MNEINESNISEYISKEALNNLHLFKYQHKNESILYNNITSPLMDKFIMPYVPLWLAPNLISLLSFLFNFMIFILIIFEAGNDFAFPLSRITIFFQAISHYLYLLFDNLDGKQARRTNTSSPLGMLFDHGFDTITTCIVAFNMSHMIMTGNYGVKTLLIFNCLFVGFWVNVYEEYTTGFLHLGRINGADEGNFMIATLALITSIFGPNIWQKTILWDIKFCEIMLTLLFIGTVQNVYQCFEKVYKLYNNYKDLISLINDSFTCNIFFNIFLPFFTMIYDEDFFKENLSSILFLFSLNFTRIILEMQINIVTNQKIKAKFMVRFTHLLYWNIIIFLKDSVENFKIVYLIRRDKLIILIIIINLATLIHYIVSCIIQIRDFLGINIFSIKTISQNIDNKDDKMKNEK